jgi:hypothetical protein
LRSSSAILGVAPNGVNFAGIAFAMIEAAIIDAAIEIVTASQRIAVGSSEQGRALDSREKKSRRFSKLSFTFFPTLYK